MKSKILSLRDSRCQFSCVFFQLFQVFFCGFKIYACTLLIFISFLIYFNIMLCLFLHVIMKEDEAFGCIILHSMYLNLSISFQPDICCCCCQLLSHIQLFAAPWTASHQAPLSMRFPRQEYWSGQPFPPPGDLPGLGIQPESPVSPPLAGRFFTTESPARHLDCFQFFTVIKL